MAALSFDIFCRVVDNFGDIGVCWRLARQLALRPEAATVRLWVDDLHSFQRIASQIDTDQAQQSLHDIDIVHWTASPPSLPPHHVVIEAFACDPPTQFVNAMADAGSIWINLEYLSAEAWVESCHGLPSMQPGGLAKYFFFPGFTLATGGLLREEHLLQTRDQWLAQPQLRDQLLQSLGIPQQSIVALQHGARQVLLFAYETAPAAGLLNSLQCNPEPTVLLVPEGVCTHLAISQSGHVHLCRIPFADQSAFDRLLWSSDINFVRGEDSLVRALWAGKPLVWQIYPQDEHAHLRKLDAWLERTGISPKFGQAISSWNTDTDDLFSQQLSALLQPEPWHQWQMASRKISDHWAAMPDLVSQLIEFCAQHDRKG